MPENSKNNLSDHFNKKISKLCKLCKTCTEEKGHQPKTLLIYKNGQKEIVALMECSFCGIYNRPATNQEIQEYSDIRETP